MLYEYRYSVRTVLGPFDRQFNAITGLNGSGKSNVLDGICFVLGITNLSKVRAGNLSELVYKQGQAGITKASVTVVFNNADKSRSPVGFESHDKITVCRQVVIGGRNRYLLNNKAAQLQEVYNLFHSVQLNINNPHFLIMQGSITKVINMKPQEILGMIEEAAGTSMYESKKITAIRTLERKQLKVDEIDRIIKEEIEPQLVKLKSEKAAFLEWSELVQKASDIERLVVSWDYRNIYGKLEGGGGTFDQTRAELDNWTRTQKALQTSVTKLEEKSKNDIKTLEKQRAQHEEIERQIDAEIQATKRKLAEVDTNIREKNSTLKSNTGKAAKSKSQESKFEKSIETKRKELAEAESVFNSEFKSRLTQIDEEIESVQKMVSDLNSGNITNSNNVSLQTELSQAKSKLEEIKTEMKTTEIKLKGLEGRLKQLNASKSQKSGVSSEYESLVRERNAIAQKKIDLETKLVSLAYNPRRLAEINDIIRSNERRIEQLIENKNSINSTISQRLDFQADLKAAGIDDPKKIKGMVAKLLSIRPEFGEKYLLALEILGGAKLFNVIVDSETTCRQLLKSGKLKKRTTILPLDKVQGKKVTQTQLRESIQIAKELRGEAVPAIETVAFVADVLPAIEYVFGNAFLCDQSEIGKRITFNNNLNFSERFKSVTVEGDVFDPKGSLTGGAGNNGNMTSRILDGIYSLQKTMYDLHDCQMQTESLQGEKSKMLTYKETYEKANKELVSVSHQFNLLESKLKSTSQSQVEEEIANIESEISAAKKRIVELEKDQKSTGEYLLSVDRELKELTRNKDMKLKELANELGALKKEKKTLSEKLKSAESDKQSLIVSLRSLEEEFKSFKEDMVHQSEVNDALESEILVLEEKSQSLRDEIEALQAKVKETKISRTSFDKSIAEVEENLNNEKIKLDEADINLKKFQSLMETLEKERKEAKSDIEKLEKEFTWLRSVRDEILRQDHPVASKSKSEIEKLKNKLMEIKDDVNIRGKSINRRIIPLIERSEKEAEDLLSKRAALEREKKTIEEFINELDDKKGRALSRTWQIVNSNFGAIFRSLLPMVDAKLAPPEGMSALEGLELRVQLGSVWKDSLTELSGGQKSLLALSLVLALLLFKPAPFYILDEVDAALDVAHTLNIGKMIKQYFPHSQFVIVSLKDGMFSNANVLFRVRFENGTSVVSRTEQQNAGTATGSAPAIEFADTTNFVEEPAVRKTAVAKKASAKSKSRSKKDSPISSSPDESDVASPVIVPKRRRARANEN